MLNTPFPCCVSVLCVSESRLYSDARLARDKYCPSKASAHAGSASVGLVVQTGSLLVAHLPGVLQALGALGLHIEVSDIGGQSEEHLESALPAIHKRNGEHKLFSQLWDETLRIL